MPLNMTQIINGALPRAPTRNMCHTFHTEHLELGKVSYRLWKTFYKIPFKV